MNTPDTQPPRRRRLGELLVAAGLLDAGQLEAALAEQRNWGGKLGRTLVELGMVDEDTMVRALSRQLNVPMVDLDRAGLPPRVVQLLRVDVAERFGVFPVGGDAEGTLLQLASADPTNAADLQEIARLTGKRLQLVVSSSSSIDRAIRRYYYGEHPPTPAPVAAPPAASRSAATESELRARVEALDAQVAQLEQLLGSQGRALRVLLELMVDKGVMTREEYVARVRAREVRQ